MSYYTAIRHATPREISRMSMPPGYQRTLRRASKENLPRLVKEYNTRRRYFSLHAMNKRAKEHANWIARNRKINNVEGMIRYYEQVLNRAKAQNLPNNNISLHLWIPHPRATIRKIIYYLKQHLKRLEFAKFLTGRKVAEMMMPKLKAHFLAVQSSRRK